MEIKWLDVLEDPQAMAMQLNRCSSRTFLDQAGSVAHLRGFLVM